MAPSIFAILLPPSILLSCLCVVEFSLISSIVSYIHLQGPLVWQISDSQYDFPLDRIPAHLHLDAGHVSNAAAGLGFFVGLLGIYIAFAARRDANPVRSGVHYDSLATQSILTKGEKERARSSNRAGFVPLSALFILFATSAVLDFLLTMSALIFSFVYDQMTSSNTISLDIASQEVGHHYTQDNWSPGTWFSAVLALPLASQSDQNSVHYHISVMKASKWMLVPLFIVVFFVMLVSLFSLWRNRKTTIASDEE